MSALDFIPGLKGSGSRRAVDKVAELREDNTRLLNRQLAADDFFAILTHDRDETDKAWRQEQRQRQQAELALASSQADNLRLAAENKQLQQQLAAYRAAEATANAVTVKPMVRDTSAIEDQATGPIDVRALWEARDAGLLGPVLDPGQVTTR